MSKTVNGGGTPPSNTVAPVISGSSAIGSTLTSTTGTWIGTPVITYAYQWKRNGSDIPSATSSTYVLVTADATTNITCQVTATNIAGSANATSNTLAIPGVAPVNTVAPVISGTNVVGSTLSSTTGTWTGAPTPTYTYQWKRGASNIGGATSSTYTLVQADATFSITCVVTATNIAGSANATSNALTIIDADAQAFFTASGLTGTTNQSAINQLVVDMKGYGIWTKMKAIYPIIGGTAALHKWNLKDPQDTNAAFRLVFNGGWTHSSTGAKGNGTNAWAATYLIPNTHLTNNSTHVNYYSRTNSAEDGTAIGGIAADAPNYSRIAMWIRWSTNQFFSDQYNDLTNRITVANTDSRGLFTSNRTASNLFKAYRNGSVIGTNTNASINLTNANQYLALNAYHQAGNALLYSARECAFASIGDGLTDTEAANFYTAVQAYQTTLGRNV